MVRGKIALALILASLSVSAATNSGPIVIENKSNITIENVRISNLNGNCITIKDSSNVTIKNSQIGPCKNFGIVTYNTENALIINNNIQNTEISIYIDTSKKVQIVNNSLDKAENSLNIHKSSEVRILLNKASRFIGPYPRGHFIQLDKLYGSNNQVLCNVADGYPEMPDPKLTTRENAPKLRVEDVINVWQSNGTPTSPIVIAYNKIRGGSSFTGSGILLGDGGGSHQVAKNNIIVNPWNVGIAVAGGSNMLIEQNKIFSNLPYNIAQAAMYVNNFYPSTSSCDSVRFNNNEQNWTWTQYNTQLWNPNTCSNISGIETNNLKSAISENIFSTTLLECVALANSWGI